MWGLRNLVWVAGQEMDGVCPLPHARSRVRGPAAGQSMSLSEGPCDYPAGGHSAQDSRRLRRLIYATLTEEPDPERRLLAIDFPRISVIVDMG